MRFCRLGKGILRALAAGHHYLSAGPRLEFTAKNKNDSQAVMMGDTLMVNQKTRSVSLRANWKDAPEDASLRLIVNGEPLEQIGIGREGTLSRTFSTQPFQWCLVELRNTNGELLALTNPIFFE